MKKLTFLLLLLIAKIPQAQQLSPAVISSAGGFFSNGTGMVSFTSGEPAVETFTSGSNILTQGFQQAWDFPTLVTQPSSTGFLFSVQPNPSNGRFRIVTRTSSRTRFVLTITDLLGKELMKKEYVQEGLWNSESVRFDAAAGIYIVKLSCLEPGSATWSQHYQKVQITN